MPSPSQISVDLPIQTLGGRVSQFAPQALPLGASPFNQDVIYSAQDESGEGVVACVGNRPGMQSFYSIPFSGVNVLDTFQRANEEPLNPANWTKFNVALTGYGDLAIIGDVCYGGSVPEPEGSGAQLWSGTPLPANQEAQVVLNGPLGGAVDICVRCNASAYCYYAAIYNSGGIYNWSLSKFVGGVYTDMLVGVIGTPNVGDVLSISAVGTTITALYNGAVLGSVVDASIAVGQPALFVLWEVVQTDTSVLRFSAGAVGPSLNPTVNYLKTFVDSAGVFHLLSLDGFGVMRDETPCPIPPIAGVPTTIGNVLAASIAQSDSLLNREWIAISTPAHPGFGIDIPRQWDGTYFDRVSQVGPGGLPFLSVADLSVPITAISRAATTGVISVTAAGHGLAPGDLVTIQGVTGDPTLNGTWPVATVAGTSFTAWGAPGQYPISSISRTGGVVTAIFSVTPFLVATNPIIVVNVIDNSYNGLFTVASVSGNTVTWNQAGGTTASSGGTLYARSISVANIGKAVTLGSGGPVTEFFAIYPGQLVPFSLSQEVTIAGDGGANINGTWIITNLQVVQSTNSNYTALSALAPGAVIWEYTVTVTGTPTAVVPNGTSTPAIAASTPAATGVCGIAGSIPAGLHQVSVSYVTRENYITKSAPWIQWYAQGGFQVTIEGLPLGPPNIIQRIIIVTPVIIPPATTGPFFYFSGSVVTPSNGTYPSMIVDDNTTTSFTGNWDDSTLQLATSATYLFGLLELGECAGFCSYSNRLFAWGERNKIPNFENLTWDGGEQFGEVPSGWTEVIGTLGTNYLLTTNAVWGFALQMQGDGVTAKPAELSQSAYQDYLGVPILQNQTPYSVRVRVQLDPTITPTQGNVHIHLQSTSLGYDAGLDIPFASLSTTYQEFIGPLTTGFTSIPTDLVLTVYIDGTPSNAKGFDIDNIEVFPTNIPYNRTLIRASYAGDPESFDQTTGYLIPGSSSDQSIRSAFTLLDKKLYFVTERGLWVTQDDGKNEPNLWSFSQISTTVGTGSVRGVDVGESWAVIAAHDGVYIFWGGEPVKISQEIQPDWDMINWAYDQTIYVVIDTFNKRIHIGAPINGSTVPNVEFVCDYSQLANSEGATSAQDIAAHPQAYYSVYNPTKVVAPGKARKWTLWNLSMNDATMAIRSDGSYHLLRGNATGTGKVYDQLASQLSDDGVAINAQYQTAYFPQIDDEQALQLTSGRKNCKYLRGFASGSGILNFSMYGADDQRGLALSPLTLVDPYKWDFEKNVDFVAERMSLLFGSDSTNTWWKITKLTPTIQKDIFTPIRGSV